MYKLCKSEQSAKRQRQLEQQLLTMMNTMHYDEITVSNFCEQAEIPRKAFYRYFSSKDGALHALLDHTLLAQDTFAASRNTGSSYLAYQELVSFYRFWYTQKPLLDALQRSDICGILVTRTVEYALHNTDHLSRLPIHGYLESIQYGTTFGVCGIMSIMLSWHHGGYQQTPEQMAEISLKLLSNPLVSSQPT